MKKSMIALFTRRLPLVSAISFAAACLFNIGYFSVIGPHFLGLIDLSNVAYSFGLALTVVVVVLNLVTMGRIVQLQLNWSDETIRKAAKVGLFAGTISSAVGIYMLATASDKASQVLPTFLGAWLLCLSMTVLSRTNEGALIDKTLAPVLVVVAFAIHSTGQFAAVLNLSSKDTYTLVTVKNVTIQNVIILRASSAGFLISVDRRISFVPQSQVLGLHASDRLL